MNWLSDPFVWVFLFPALAASGILIQMILGLFSCCGTFRLQGRSIHLKWWMIPLAGVVTAVLWGSLGVYLLLMRLPG